MGSRPGIDADTLDQVSDTITRMNAVGDYARHGAVTDRGAGAAGYYADRAIGSPETLLYGPEGWPEQGCDVADAWLAHMELSSGEVRYHVGAGGSGNIEMTMRVPGTDPQAPPVELTVGVSERLGLYADPVTVQALGGTPSHPPTGIAPARFDRDTGMRADLENLNAAGVGKEDRDRLWSALNEASHTHPDAQLARHHLHDGDRRDLPHHETLDRTLIGIDELTPPAAPGGHANARENDAARNRTTPERNTEPETSHSWC